MPHCERKGAATRLSWCILRQNISSIDAHLQMEKMDKSFEAVQRSFTTVRTGRANPSMLDRIQAGIHADVLPRATACDNVVHRADCAMSQLCTTHMHAHALACGHVLPQSCRWTITAR